MRQNSAKIWLRGCKPRVYKKHHWGRIDVDGSFITLKEYTEHIRQWKKKKVGDPIFNTFRNRWETLKEIRYKWWDLERIPNGRYLEITGITDHGFMVYELDAEKYSLSDEDYKKFMEEWGPNE